jgi:hypothetical protein
MKMFIATLCLSVLSGVQALACPAHASLDFPQSGLNAHLEWVISPEGNTGESILRVQWTKLSDGTAFEPRGFSAVLWMPSMNHGSAPTQVQRVLDNQGNIVPGTYDVRNMYFVMPGDWEVRFTVQNDGSPSETQVWAFNIEGEHGGGHGHGGHHHATPSR